MFQVKGWRRPRWEKRARLDSLWRLSPGSLLIDSVRGVRQKETTRMTSSFGFSCWNRAILAEAQEAGEEQVWKGEGEYQEWQLF